MKKRKTILIIISAAVALLLAGGYLFLRHYTPEIEIKPNTEDGIAGYAIDRDGTVLIEGDGIMPDLYDWFLHYVYSDEELHLLAQAAFHVNPRFHAKRVVISEDVTGYGEAKQYTDYVFRYCDEIQSIEVDESNPNLSSEDGVLFNKDKTVLLRYPAGNPRTEYIIPDSVKEISAEAFDRCGFLKRITFPSALETVGKCAFSECGLTYADIPEGVTKLEEVFFHCDKLEEFSLPSTLTEFTEGTFGYASLQAINVSPDNEVYKSEDGVLFSKDGTKLLRYPTGAQRTLYAIPDGVEEIGDGAFSGAVKLQSASFPDSVRRVGEWSFEGCKALSKVEFGHGIAHIGQYAFYNCKNLQRVQLPNSVKGIDYSAMGFYSGRSDVKKVNGFTIVCSDDAAAPRRYAEKNGFALEINSTEE